MTIVITVIAYISVIAPEQIFQRLFLLIFLRSYTTLLFTFSYIFSKVTKKRAELISIGFGSIGIIAGLTSLLGSLSDSFTIYRAIAFFGLAIFCFGTIIFEYRNQISKSRWYLAVQPAAILLYDFL